MEKVKTDELSVIDRFLLRLASERRVGGPGRPLKELVEVLGDAGVDREHVDESLEVLMKRKWVEPKGRPAGRRALEDEETVFAITAEGKEYLRRQEATTQYNIRVPEALTAELERLAERRGESMSARVVRTLEESVRMERFPGIDFRWSPSGRDPYMTGTGVGVWELYPIWLDHNRDVEWILKNYPGWKRSQIQAAVAYAEAYLHEMPEGGFGKRPPFAREVKV